MKTGIIMDFSDGNALIMQEGGIFILIPAKPNWKKGDVVPIATKKLNIRVLSSIAACFLFLSLFLGAGYQIYTKQTSVISIDINPSIELGFNRFDHIISVTSLNEEGMQILSKLNLKGLDYKKAIKQLLNSEYMEGYLTEDTKVVITVFSNSKKQQDILYHKIQETTDSILSNYQNVVQTECHLVDEKTLETAHNYGVTAGKYLYLQKLNSIDSDISIAAYAHHSIEEIENQIATCKRVHGTIEDSFQTEPPQTEDSFQTNPPQTEDSFQTNPPQTEDSFQTNPPQTEDSSQIESSQSESSPQTNNVQKGHHAEHKNHNHN